MQHQQVEGTWPSTNVKPSKRKTKKYEYFKQHFRHNGKGHRRNKKFNYYKAQWKKMVNEIDMITNTKYNKFLKARSTKVVQKKKDEE